MENLVSIEELSSRAININRAPYIEKNVPFSKTDAYLSDGWNLIPSKLKKSQRIRKYKKHNDAFEDRVWGLFARMGFEYINSNNKFKLSYSNNLSKQIDIFTYDSEAILIIECKSSATRRKASYQKDINELIGLKSKLISSAKKIAGKKQKVAIIFCTNNSILSEPDRERLKNGNIIHLNQDAIEYFEQLTDHLGKAAKYQLFGKLFSNQEIPNLKNRIPAIKGRVANGLTIYTFCIEPKFLLKIGYVLHRSDVNSDSINSYQRLVKKSRLKQISKYVEDNGYFPNSIIINLETKNNKKLRFDVSEKVTHDGNTNMGILHLPKRYRSAFIIDGQHRLLGYTESTDKRDHLIPVVAFENLPEEEQSKIFVDVNHNQKSVPANLLQSIRADFYWGSDNRKMAMSALKTRIFTIMNFDDSSPFYKRIILAEEKKSDIKCLTINALNSWGMNKVGYFGKFKGEENIKKGFIQGKNDDKTLKKAIDFYNIVFSYIESKLKVQWDIGNGEGGFIAMNVGVSAIIRVLEDILEFIALDSSVDFYQLSGIEIGKLTFEYIELITNFLSNLDSHGIKKLRGHLGAGAPEKILREFQVAINYEIPQFSPKGLNQWVKDNSGQFDSVSYDIGHNKIEPMIDNIIKAMLKKEYGINEDNWWRDGVPIKIQKNCAARKIEQRSQEPDWNYLTTIDYESIISNKWKIFEKVFSPPNMGNVSKVKKLYWIKEFNKIRQKYSHPQRESISEKEYISLNNLYEWLMQNTKKLTLHNDSSF